MAHRATTKYWFHYRQLSDEIRTVADRAFESLKSDARHPSLQFKKVGRYWSVRVGLHHRALAVEAGTDLVWFWIGSHDEYERQIHRV